MDAQGRIDGRPGMGLGTPVGAVIGQQDRETGHPRMMAGDLLDTDHIAEEVVAADVLRPVV
jgi:hypothetical protein